jgi:hypothetical protein
MPAAVGRAGIAVALAFAAAIPVGCDDDSATPASDSAPATIPQPSQRQLDVAGLGDLPESKRVDIAAPVFSNPTKITNPLFPISDLQSVVFSGHLDQEAFHTETTLLPQTRVIEWSPGQQVKALVSQYVAYVEGRLEEVALDYYAQADDGAVWYLGEDVQDYRDGSVYTTEGSWLAGLEGPPEMIMPGDPQVGDVHRAENIPAIAFEEVTIKNTGETVRGPTGPVDGAMVASELHDDGTVSDKIFAPGYGEFFTKSGGELEALALAVPTNALDGPPPPELKKLAMSAGRAFDAVQARDWGAARDELDGARRAWAGYRRSEKVPLRLAPEMAAALDAASAGIAARDRERAANAAIDVSQSALDQELRYLPQPEIDLARFDLWMRQIVVDAAAGDLGAVTGDVATLEWVRDRFAQTLDPVDRTRIDTHLVELQGAVGDEDPKAAAREAQRARTTLSGIGPAG